jgi:Uma2 family endonuclease
MPTVVLDGSWVQEILEKRRAQGNRTHDEVWEGVTYIMPEPDNEHERIAAFFIRVFGDVFGVNPANSVQRGANISDRIDGWKENYRSPDMAYYSADTPAEDHKTFWYGGPNFLLEIISPDDMSRDKLPFYAAVGTREVLILDRDPWRLELFELRRGRLRPAGTARPGDDPIASHVGPLTFALVRNRPRPKIRITQTETGQVWTF